MRPLSMMPLVVMFLHWVMRRSAFRWRRRTSLLCPDFLCMTLHLGSSCWIGAFDDVARHPLSHGDTRQRHAAERKQRHEQRFLHVHLRQNVFGKIQNGNHD